MMTILSRYNKVKRSLPKNIILFFRVKDWYETFNDDAILASDLLKIPLTKRNGIQMAGIPYHEFSSHSKVLISKNIKFATAHE